MYPNIQKLKVKRIKSHFIDTISIVACLLGCEIYMSLNLSMNLSLRYVSIISICSSSYKLSGMGGKAGVWISLLWLGHFSAKKFSDCTKVILAWCNVFCNVSKSHVWCVTLRNKTVEEYLWKMLRWYLQFSWPSFISACWSWYIFYVSSSQT